MIRVAWVNRGPQLIVGFWGYVFSCGWPTRYAKRWWRPWWYAGRVHHVPRSSVIVVYKKR